VNRVALSPRRYPPGTAVLYIGDPLLFGGRTGRVVDASICYDPARDYARRVRYDVRIGLQLLVSLRARVLRKDTPANRRKYGIATPDPQPPAPNP